MLAGGWTVPPPCGADEADTVLPGAFGDPLPFAVFPAHAPGGRQGHVGPGSSPGTQSFGKIGLKPSRAEIFAPTPRLPGTRGPL